MMNAKRNNTLLQEKSLFLSLVGLLFVLTAGLGRASEPETRNAETNTNVIVQIQDKLDHYQTARHLSSKYNLHLRHVYIDVFDGFSGEIPAKKLQSFLDSRSVARINLDKKATPVEQEEHQKSVRVAGHRDDEEENGNDEEPDDDEDDNQKLPSPTNVKTVNADQVNHEDLPLDQVNIAVIDTKVDQDHPYLQNQITHQSQQTKYHRVPDISSPMDLPKLITWQYWAHEGEKINGPQDHGTHVAGLIGGKESELVGQFGMAPGVNIYDLAVFPDLDEYAPYLGDIASALDHVVQLKKSGTKIHAVNMSLGVPTTKDSMGRLESIFRPGWSEYSIRKAVKTVVKEHQIPVVAAAGNDGENVDGFHSDTAPAIYPETIAVSALNSREDNLKLARFSNFGDAVDVTAPGYKSVSTIVDGIGTKSGTSMAAPTVTGVIGLLQAANLKTSEEQTQNSQETTGSPTVSNAFTQNHSSSLSPKQILGILQDTGRKPDNHWGNSDMEYEPKEPLVQADKAVDSVLGSTQYTYTVDDTGKIVRISSRKLEQMQQSAKQTGATQTTTRYGGEKTETYFFGLFSNTYQYQVQINVTPEGTVHQEVNRTRQ